MLPLGDAGTGQRRVPLVNVTLIAVNVVAFLVELSQPDPQAFITRWGAIPDHISAGQDLVTLVTSMFLHGGWLHLLGNMLFLFIFGDNVEDAFGHTRYLLFYLTCGIAAGLAQVFLVPTSTVPGIGASGAIAGVLGAYLLMFGRNPVRVLIVIFPAVLPAWLMIGVWFILQLVNVLGTTGQAVQSGGVAYAAHVGGFISGMILCLPFRPARRPPPRWRRW